MKKNIHIAICAGGTGGHVFPAMAVASALRKKGCRLSIYTDERGISWANKSKSTAYNISSKAVSGRSIFKKFIALYLITAGYFQALKYLKTSPIDAIIGFGGYATVPTILAARTLGIPILIHEQNALCGRANRLLGRVAKIICTAFENPVGVDPKKCVLTGNPVRENIAKLNKKYTLPRNNVLCVLITGGSQGAKIFGVTIALTLAKFKPHICVIHQVRKDQIAKVEEIYKKAKIKAEVSCFIEHMSDAYKKAHYTICRSGAGTIMENAIVSMPSIMIPYKYATDNHQYYNAIEMEKIGGGIVLNEDDFCNETLQKIIEDILSPKANKLLTMSKCAGKLSIHNAQDKLAEQIITVANANIKKG